MKKALPILLASSLLISLSVPGFAAEDLDALRQELNLWESVKDSRDARQYQHYLDRYPDGYFSELDNS
ncbi:MAG: hypothetical protein U5R48_02895 [Gammaproteobacteria bacterium]|nr:hypothetical protein [Gammaproteobacteria bacterium]